MDTHALHHYPHSGALGRWLGVGFLSGAVAVLAFHQGALALLHVFQLSPRAPYSFAPTLPFGVPELWSLAFWGGVWGVVLAAAFARLDGARLVLASLLFGLLLPTLIAWFAVAPLKGQPLAAGGAPLGMMAGLVVNAAWGFGAGLGLALFGRSHG